MLFRTLALDLREESVAHRVDELRRTLGYAVSPRRWSGLLRRNAFARALRGSNSIEGYNVTVDDAVAAAEGEEPLDPKTEAWAAVWGYRQAMTYVLQLADDPHFTFSVDLLRSLHYMMTGHDLTRNPGRWRPGSIFVRDEAVGTTVYEGPRAELVPGLMEELVSSLADAAGASVLVQAAMGHLNLVMIHPFSDGNGRMARCLQTLVLARGGVLSPIFSSIEEYLGRNTRDYYDVLAEVGGGSWQPERNARSWIRFCLTAHFRQASTFLRRSRELQRVWDELEGIIGQKRLPERVLLALSDAAMGYRVRNATYRSAAEVSEAVAGKDLRELVTAGLLEARGEKRGRFYVASPVVMEIRERCREPKMIADPFADDSWMPVLPGMEPFRS